MPRSARLDRTASGRTAPAPRARGAQQAPSGTPTPGSTDGNRAEARRRPPPAQDRGSPLRPARGREAAKLARSPARRCRRRPPACPSTS